MPCETRAYPDVSKLEPDVLIWTLMTTNNFATVSYGSHTKGVANIGQSRFNAGTVYATETLARSFSVLF